MHYPKTEELMFGIWLEEEFMTPDVVFNMLPISAKTSLAGGLGNFLQWNHIVCDLAQWLRYVKAFNDRRRYEVAKTYTVFFSIYTDYDPQDLVIDQLMLHSEKSDQMNFLEYLRLVEGMDSFVSSLQKRLLVFHTLKYKNALRQEGKSGLDPEVV
uniref:Uncharacterized protein n=1 Tax=Peronospora matthiolae TaxID=2874970 RepID=A0AAV1UCT6_9STRA